MTVIAYVPEPASHRTIETIALTPDAYIEVGIKPRKYLYWLEVDRGTENADVIRGKLVRYWRAFQAWPEETYPYVAFIVPGEVRKRELERIIAGGPEAAKMLFQVYLSDGFAASINAYMRTTK